MKYNNFNNAVNNNTDNETFGGMTMMNKANMTMDVFAEAVKAAVENSLGENATVEIHEVLKNNGTRLNGLIIRSVESNIAPAIYLEGFYRSFLDGASDLDEIIHEIIRVYEENKATKSFDAASVTDFALCRSRICYKLVNAASNKELLADAPHLIVCGDLAVIFYILVKMDEEGTASITVRNNMLELWNVTAEELYTVAMDNTMRLFRGSVSSMANALMGLISDRMDIESAHEFYDMVIPTDDTVPMFVCTNSVKVNGAGVILYRDILKNFTARIENDLYILPSSIHETILIPVTADTDISYLRSMVREINATEVADEDLLSDNVYVYHRDTDSIELA